MQDRLIEDMNSDLAHIERTLADYKSPKPPSPISPQEKAKRRAANKRARKARRR